MHRALSIWGALVVLALAGTASADTAVGNAVGNDFKKLTDDQVNSLVNTYDAGLAGAVSDIGPRIFKTSTYSGNITYKNPGFASYLIGAVYEGKIVIEDWFKFREELPKFTGPVWQEDGMVVAGSCYMSDADATVFSGSNQRPQNRKYDFVTGKRYRGGTNYRILLRNSDGDVAYSDSNYLADDINPMLKDWSSHCITKANITLTAWRDGVYPVPGAHNVAQEIKESGSTFLKQVGGTIYNPPPSITFGPALVERDLSAPPSDADDSGDSDSGSDSGSGGSGSGSGTGGSSASSPACTKSNGQTSGNPYDCAPTDSETSCSIIDIPCNLKKAFVPSSDFFSKGLLEYTNNKLNLPIEIVHKLDIDTDSKIFPHLTIDFTDIDSPVTQSVLRLIAWFQIAFYVLNYIGFPNPFGGSRRGDGYVAQSVVDNYDSMRNTFDVVSDPNKDVY